ncbi:MAG: hypothetical protein WAO23_00825 [Dethiobacteria bacterium]
MNIPEKRPADVGRFNENYKPFFLNRQGAVIGTTVVKRERLLYYGSGNGAFYFEVYQSGR